MTLASEMDWQNLVVLAGALVFMAFLLWRMRPVRKGLGVVGSMAKNTMQARAKARDAAQPRERAAILHAAAAEIASQRGGAFAALSLFLRALRADPSWPEPIEGLRKLLWLRRPHALERLLWKRLGSSSWQGEQRPVACASARVLSDLYRARLHNRSRAAVFSKVAESLQAAKSGGPQDNR
jgi:hypothetical protein